MPKRNKILPDTKKEGKNRPQVIEINVHQGQVKIARTKPNDQKITQYSKW